MTLVALAGMLAAVGLAWPHPRWIIAVGVFDMLARGWAAFRWRMPILHVGAIAFAALAYLTAFHLVAGDLKMPADEVTSMNMLRLTLSGRSGTVLGGLFLPALAAISEWLAQSRLSPAWRILLGWSCAAQRRRQGWYLTTYHGFANVRRKVRRLRLRAAILYGILWSWRRLDAGGTLVVR